MLALIFALLAAGEPTDEVESDRPSLNGVQEDEAGCINVDFNLLDILDGVLRSDFETLARLADKEIADRFDQVAEKSYQRSELVRALAKDKVLAAKIAAAKKRLVAATYCLGGQGAETSDRSPVAFFAGQFRIAMGNSLMEDRLNALVLLGNPETGLALTVGAWKRVECWEAEDSFTKPCGPVFKDMPKAVKAVVEEPNIRVRWTWRGLPKKARGAMLVPWRGSMATQRTDLLSVENPSLEFFDGEKVLWTAR